MLLASLYFAEGAPIGWLWWALPTRLRASGASVAEITALTAALALPWSFKFLWAPLVDGLRGPRWGLRAWALTAQLGMTLSLLPLLGGVDLGDPVALLPVLLVHAVCAATQDVAIDGLAVRALPLDERGGANGWMQVGMLAGRGLFGGLALRAEDWIGVHGVVLALMAATLWSSLLLAFAAREPASARAELTTQPRLGARMASLGRALLGLLRSRRVLAGAGFALLGGAGFEALGGTSRSLLVDLGVERASIGDFFALPVILCMASGALLGGRWADARPRARAARDALLWVSASVLAAAAAVLLRLDTAVVLGTLALAYVTLGMLTAASYALFMDLCEPRVAATQFSAFMGLTNLCETGAVWGAGLFIASRGEAPSAYATAWVLLVGVSLLALPLLRALAAPGDPPSADTPPH